MSPLCGVKKSTVEATNNDASHILDFFDNQSHTRYVIVTHMGQH